MLHCDGVGAMVAFSGRGNGRDNPAATSQQAIGPIPKGIYYIIDRQSGGRIGWFRDLWGEYGYGTTDHTEWFMLWNPKTGDSTMVDGVKRGAFRLHPVGPMGLSEGCITIANPGQFKQLATYLRGQGATIPVPGSPSKAYGTVEVR